MLKYINKLKKDDDHLIYLSVRDCILKLINSKKQVGSDYWQEEIEGFDYMFDASPLITRKFREHCYHITGLKSYEYRNHHVKQKKAFIEKYSKLSNLDKSDLFKPESNKLGGFGHNIDGNLINIDTLKFYEAMIALDKASFLPKTKKEKKIFLEIGGGWGGFACQFKQNFPNVTYIIIDLPETLLFSAYYISALFKNCKIYVDGENKKISKDDIANYDFLFLTFENAIKIITKVDVTLNMISFQEMTSDQVDNYLKWLKKINCKKIYSFNRKKSKYNNQIKDVIKQIENNYNVKEIKLLNEQYIDLPRTTKPKNIITKIFFGLKNIINIYKIKNNSNRYRHIAGLLKKE